MTVKTLLIWIIKDNLSWLLPNIILALIHFCECNHVLGAVIFEAPGSYQEAVQDTLPHMRLRKDQKKAR